MAVRLKTFLVVIVAIGGWHVVLTGQSARAVPPDAQAAFDRAIERLAELGTRRLQDMKSPDALQDFRRAVAIDPSFGNAWFYIANISFNNGDLEDASRALASARSSGRLTMEYEANQLTTQIDKATAAQSEASRNLTAPPKPMSPGPTPAQTRGPVRARARQTVWAAALESTMWRPLTFVCGATYEVTFLDPEARDWTFWRLGRRANNLASSDTPFEAFVWNGVPRVGTRIYIPSSLCPGGSGNVTLDSYASWSRSGYGRVAVLDEVEADPVVEAPSTGIVGLWNCGQNRYGSSEGPWRIFADGRVTSDGGGPVLRGTISGTTIRFRQVVPFQENSWELTLVGTQLMGTRRYSHEAGLKEEFPLTCVRMPESSGQ